MLLRLSRSLSMFVCLAPYPFLFYRASQRNRSWVASLLCGVTCGLSTGNAGTSPTGSGCLVRQLPTGCMTENMTRCSWTPWQDWWASLCRGFVQNFCCTKVSLVPSPYALCSCCCTAAVEQYCSSYKCREDGGWINVNLYRSTATLVLYCLCGLECETLLWSDNWRWQVIFWRAWLSKIIILLSLSSMPNNFHAST